MSALVQPTTANICWSFESPNCFFHYYAHPVRDAGGNAVVIYLHGGGGKSNDPRILTHAGTRPQCVVFETLRGLTGSDQPHFDFIGLGYDQWSTAKPHPQSSLGASWKTAGAPDPDTGLPISAPTYPNATYPNGRDIVGAANPDEATWGMQTTYNIGRYGHLQSVNQIKRAILVIKSMATRYGGTLDIDPDNVFLMGTSWGGWLAMTSQFQPPLVVPQQAALSGYEWFHLEPGVTSQVRGIINWYGHPDIREGGPQVIAKGGSATDEPLPQVVTEAFHGRHVADQDLPEQLKGLYSPQWFMENAKAAWAPSILHFMFSDPNGTYPLPPPYHQSDLGYDAVRYGGAKLQPPAVIGDVNPDYREQLMSQVTSAGFNATSAEGLRMRNLIAAWSLRCMV